MLARLIGLVSLLVPFFAHAQPSIGSVFMFTENRQEVPGLITGGYTLVIGSTSITGPIPFDARAIHLEGIEPDYLLNGAPSPLFPNLHAARVPYIGQTGTWTLSATDEGGLSAAANTHVLSDPRMLPLIEGLEVSGPALAPHVSWQAPANIADFPDFCFIEECGPGSDFFSYQVEVRLAQAGGPLVYLGTPLDTMDNNFEAAPTEFDLPAGILQPGTDYLIGLRFNHSDTESVVPIPDGLSIFAPVENRSTVFALHTAAIPEPQTYALLLAGLALLGFAARRKMGSDPIS